MDADTEAPPAAVPAAPTPQARDEWYSKLYSGGLDHLEDNLDPGTRNDLTGSLYGSQNPAEDKARMVNQAYAQENTAGAPGDLAANWDIYRDHFASAITGQPQVGVTDTKLFGLINTHIQKQQGEHAMLGRLGMAMLSDAVEGGTSYLSTFQRMHQEMQADPNYDPHHEDQYLFAAKGMWEQVQKSAVRIAPAAQIVAKSFIAQAEDYSQPASKTGSLYDEPSAEQVAKGRSYQAAEDAALPALKALNPEERQLALHAATEIASRTIGQEEEDGQVKEPGTHEMLDRGTATLVTGAVHTAMRLIPAAAPAGAVSALMNPDEDQDIQRDMGEAYQAANQPKGSRGAKAWYGFAGQLPALAGMVLQPELGVTLALGQMADQNMGALEKRGVPTQEALVGGLVAAAPAAAVMKLQGTILEGSSMPWLSDFSQASARSIGALAGKTLGHFGFNAAVLNFGQAAMDSLEPATQDLISRFDKSVPGVDWKQEFKQIGATRLDTFLNLLPLALVGTGAATLKESAFMRSYLAQKDFMKAVGFTEPQLDAIAKAPDAQTASHLIQEAWAAQKPAEAKETAAGAPSAGESGTSPAVTPQPPANGGAGAASSGDSGQGPSEGKVTVVKPKGKTISVGDVPGAGPDILNYIEEQGGIQTKSGAGKKAGGEHDDIAGSFTGVARLLLRKNGMRPDELAQMMGDEGMLPDGSVRSLTDAVEKAVTARAVARKQFNLGEYGQKFDQAFLGGEQGKKWLRAGQPISVDDLVTGDTFHVNGEKFTVKDVDENGNVTIQDGVKRVVPPGTQVHPDKGLVSKNEGSGEFVPGDKAAAMARVDAKMDESAKKIFQPNGAGVVVGEEPHKAVAGIETSAQMIADQNEHGPEQMFHVEQSGEETSHGEAEKNLLQNLSTVEPAAGPTIAERIQQHINDSQKMGIAMPMPAGVMDWLGDARRAAGDAVRELRNQPEMTPFKTALNELIGRMQRNTMDVQKLVHTIREMVPDAVRREGITNWIQAGGDKATLQAWHDATKGNSLKKGYAAALNLSPDEVKVANFIKEFFDQKFKELSAIGLVKNAVENYVNQIWKKDFVGSGDAAQFAGKLQRNFKFGEERTFGSFFEGEQADFSPMTKDVSNLAGTYLSESNKVIATREFLKHLTTLEASDSSEEQPRPLAAPFGGGTISQSKEEGPTMIRPMARGENLFDYKVIDHPAMRDWKWLGKDAGGQGVMLEGQLGIHPEVRRFVNALIGKDRLKEWYQEPSGAVASVIKAGLKTIDEGASQAKGMMFSLSGYHQLQESVRALGYRINPFSNLPDLESKDPMIVRSTNAGLMLAADHGGMRDFMEGYGSNNPFYKIPWAGDLANHYSSWFFESYLPRLKQKTWAAVAERNMDRYSGELKSGAMKPADVDYLSATQVNAAYGHLNYVDLGRSPTARHIARITLLAPDFLESTSRVVGQAGKALIGNKGGFEQLKALAVLGLTQYLTARVLNKTIDGNWHEEEPFGVVVGNRVFSIRSIPADVVDAVDRGRQFATSRISPLLSSAWEVGSGKNFRGEQVSTTDALRDVATNVLPMSLRPFLGKTAQGAANVPIWDQFITAQGLRLSRNSEMNKAFHLGEVYQRENGVPPDSGIYPVSQFQQMRYALEDGEKEKAQAEWNLLTAQKGKTPQNLEKGFRESLFRPFSGAKKTESDFEDSLTGSDAKALERAKESRSQVWSLFMDLDLNHGQKRIDTAIETD